MSARIYGCLVALSGSLWACQPEPAAGCVREGAACIVAGDGDAAFAGDGMRPREASFYYPVDVAFDSQNRLYINDQNNLRIRRVNDGVLETVVGNGIEGTLADGSPGLQTPLHHAFHMEIDGDDQLFLSGFHAPFVYRIDARDAAHPVRLAAGSDVEGFAGDGGRATEAELYSPMGVAVALDGGFFVADTGNNCVRRVGADGVIDSVAGTGDPGLAGDAGDARAAHLTNPMSVAVHPRDGTLYIADTFNHRIRRVDDSGVIHGVAGSDDAARCEDGDPAARCALDEPHDLAFDAAGVLYIADTGNDRVLRIGDDGRVETVLGGADGTPLDRPQGIGFDREGRLCVADTLHHRVLCMAELVL